MDLSQSAPLEALKKVTQEIISEETLVDLLERAKKEGITLRHYIGYEISGRPHIGSGLATMLTIRELQKLGIHCTIFLADWHAWINDKLGGDLDFIKQVGTPYFKECMIASAKCVGIDPNSLEFLKASDIVDNSNYWQTMIDVSKNTTVSRMQRSIDIMGRKDGEKSDFAKLIYPAMQAADIFKMQTHIMHGGMDQRKAHVIVIDCALQMKTNAFYIGKDENGQPLKVKPVAVHNALLMGLTTPSKEMQEATEVTYEMLADAKMSKSVKGSAVFINDTVEDVNSKIKNAYCPEGIVKLNPVLDWAKRLCFNLGNETLEINRKAEWGGDKTYLMYAELEKDFIDKKLHPVDLKNAVAKSINKALEPAREHLNTPEIKDLEAKIQEKVTR